MAESEKWTVVNDAPSGDTWRPVYEGTPAPPRETHTTREAISRGLGQGASMGWADEVGAALDTALSKIPGVRSGVEAVRGGLRKVGLADPSIPLTNSDATYEERRDFARKAQNESKADHPVAYTGGQVGGALATTLVPGAGAAKGAAGGVAGLLATVGKGAALGAASGLGGSESQSFEGQLSDAFRGALFGGATAGVVHGLGSGFRVVPPQEASQLVLPGVSAAESGATPQLGGVIPDIANKAGNVIENLSHVGKLGGVGAIAHGDPLLGGVMMLAPAAVKMTRQGADMLAKALYAAENGNVAAQNFVSALRSTPDGAAKIAALLSGKIETQ